MFPRKNALQTYTHIRSERNEYEFVACAKTMPFRLYLENAQRQQKLIVLF